MGTKFRTELQKMLRCGRSGGGGGWSVISDGPGRGGSQKGKILADVLYGWPQTEYEVNAGIDRREP